MSRIDQSPPPAARKKTRRPAGGLTIPGPDDFLSGMAKHLVEVRLESEDFPGETLGIVRVSGEERISRLFELEVTAVAPTAEEPTRESMTGANATLVFYREEVEVRRLHGMIAEVNELLETEVATRTFSLRFVPRAHRLTLAETQEIYMHKTLPEILTEKLERVGLGADDVVLRLSAKYRKIGFVVQYKETDLAFISRLCEHYGLSFHFEHDTGRDQVVFTDGTGFSELEARPRVPLRPRGERRDVYRLEVRTKVIPATYVVDDYNYRTPQVDVSGSYESALGFGGGVVEYGTHLKTPDEGAHLAKIRGEEREAGREVFTGTSDVCELYPGARITLDGQGRRDDLDLLVVSVRHDVTQVSGVHGGGDAVPYENTFQAIDGKLVYRSPRVTPRPRIAGIMHGTVEELGDGVPGRFARIDDQGRYRVRFLFDTAADGERKASRPVRMAQGHAGANYGVHFPLRPGTEVLMAFIDGDPDRPIIVGAVPNPVTPSPVVAQTSLLNRIKTATGVLIEMKDA